MSLSVFALCVLLSIASASPILISECGVLLRPFSTYQLAQDIAIRNSSYEFVCFNIAGEGITLDGNGYEISSASNKMLHATGVQYSSERVVVKNLHIKNIRTGIHAKGRFGEIYSNTITHAINGIDISETNNNIHDNVISQFEASEATAGIYVYFPAITPVDSFTNITNNVISDIKGDSFVLGISVYYATAVFIAHNVIFNLQGGISSQAISVIHGKIDSHDNSFHPNTPEGEYKNAITIMASVFSVVASLVFFLSSSSFSSSSFSSSSFSSSSFSSSSFSSSSPRPLSLPNPPEQKESKEEEEREKEIQKEEEFEVDGADVRRKSVS